MKRFPIMKYVMLFLCCTLCIGTLCSCGQLEQYEYASDRPEVYMGEDLFYCNGPLGIDTDEQIFPDFEIEKVWGTEIFYKNVTVLKLNQYCDLMEQKGFEVVRYDYASFFYSDACWIRISHSKDCEGGSARLEYCAQTENLPKTAVTAERAEQIIGIDCPYPLVDVTPAAVYEQMGGRIFSLPRYGDGQLSMEEYESAIEISWDERPRGMYFVTEEYAIPMGMEHIAYTDMDQNGTREIWVLDWGPTSGLFTFELSAYENGECKYRGVFYSDHGTLSFCQKDGALRVCANVNRYFNGEWYTEHHEYTIRIDNGRVSLYDGLTPLDLWGTSKEP